MNLDKESELQQMISVCGKLDLLDRLLSLLKVSDGKQGPC